MIAQNEVNVQWELAHKTDNPTVSYKHPRKRALVQIKWWCLYDYSITNSRSETHCCFFTYTRHNMNFHSCEKQIFKYFGWTKIRKDLDGTKTSPNEVIQTTATRQLEKLIFDCLPIVAGSWKSRFKIFQFKCLLNQLGCCP